MASMMLVCAVMASLALGVLAAYGICFSMFRVFRVQSLAAAQKRAEARSTAAAATLTA